MSAHRTPDAAIEFSANAKKNGFGVITETKIIIFQLSFLTFEILYFFWLRKYFNEEEKRIREYYR